MRQENYWSQMVYLYGLMLKEKGRDAALRVFRDGGGYFVQAYTWVPLVPPARAFILYVCWEQANLRGNPGTLQALGDREATLQSDPVYRRRSLQSSHLRTQRSREDYEAIFDTIWQDRAERAGWKLAIDKAGTLCTFHFT